MVVGLEWVCYLDASLNVRASKEKKDGKMNQTLLNFTDI